ncbi:type VI secretion system lipoprotein TssJ [Paraburkholderia sp.]|uniref:type VI secretion system lipoprotein TssJ n=1 Tax=Paraburkholderia sp. TaxID=1926495 RepID=UPI00239013EC|nr:type VI secretion system lipoprotein TssJ [Paraburkholderia sp.]MDE1180316.1 type VI secretion system lipoprotein TssJ [Paraburkholderia sp.]
MIAAIRLTSRLRALVALVACVCVSGCGVAHAIKQSANDVARWTFIKPVSTMNIDLAGRASLNPTGSGQSLSTVVRLYQLKSTQTFDQLDYAQLQRNDVASLKPDLLATFDAVLRPDERASISQPMERETSYVGVVAFFRDPAQDGWKVVVPRQQWRSSDPVRIELRGNTLEVTGLRAGP